MQLIHHLKLQLTQNNCTTKYLLDMNTSLAYLSDVFHS